MTQADKRPTREQVTEAAHWLDGWSSEQVHSMEETFTGAESVEFYLGMVAAIGHGRRVLQRMLEQAQSPVLMDMTFSAYQSCAARQAQHKEKQDAQDR